jgi:hypothetical protein
MSLAAASMQLVLTLSALSYARAQPTAIHGQWVEAFRTQAGGARQTTLQLYGNPTAISDDGGVIAVGCEVSSGVWETRIYQEDPTTKLWDIQSAIPASGFSVSLSSDGTKVALGDVAANGQNGRVFVMAKQQNGTWVQEGADILPIGTTRAQVRTQCSHTPPLIAAIA